MLLDTYGTLSRTLGGRIMDIVGRSNSGTFYPRIDCEGKLTYTSGRPTMFAALMFIDDSDQPLYPFSTSQVASGRSFRITTRTDGRRACWNVDSVSARSRYGFPIRRCSTLWSITFGNFRLLESF